MILGKIHSLQSLGTVDGPGVRFVVFVQGCPLRCKFCHNPDTWDFDGGDTVSAEEIVKKVMRYREYFKDSGGITVSGGEPLMQAEFVREIFSLCKKEGINTCLDTSGSIINDEVIALLDECDRVMLDIKYTEDEQYKKYVGCSIEKPLAFLEILSDKNIPTTIRQVIIPTINDTKESVLALKDIVKSHSCVDKVELLAFRKMCSVKYDNLGKVFPFKDIPEPTKEKMAELEALIKI